MINAGVKGVYIGKAKNPDSVSTPSLVSPLQRLRQRTGCDDAGLFASESDACAAAMALAQKWGERHRRGKCGVVLASGGRFDALIESMASAFCRVAFNDLVAMDAAIDSSTVAIVLEPIQGQSVVTPASQAYVQGVAKLCRELNILLILNDARGTSGQQGGLLCEEAYGVTADIVVLGDHTNCSPRSAALLVRGHARTAEVDRLPGFVPEPVSTHRPQVSRPKPQAMPYLPGLLA
jgi:acetylornithine/succinyldiaminopimelate/putrescine aminotransferase